MNGRPSDSKISQVILCTLKASLNKSSSKTSTRFRGVCKLGTCEISFQISTNDIELHHVETKNKLSNKKKEQIIL